MKRILLLALLCASAKPQAADYNPIYRGEAGEVFSRKPNAFLVDVVRQRRPGAALDAGMGQGRNSIYLAQQGWQVTGFDPADEGVRQARAEAERLGLKIRAEVEGFDTFEFGEERWDLIVLAYVDAKAMAPRVARALRPGGVVVVEDRHVDTRRVWPAGTFADNELLALFPGLRVVRYEDAWARPDWSAKQVDERLVRLAAEKPRARAGGCVWAGRAVPEGAVECWGKVTLRCGREGWQFSRAACAP